MQAAELAAAIGNQNNFPENKLKEIKNEITPLFAIRRKSTEVSSWVLEVTPEARITLLSKERLHIAYKTCKVEDYLRISRCYNCQKFGHASKDCKNTRVCSICAQDGHGHDNCKIKEDKAICRNCRNYSNPANHSVRSVTCPYYQSLIRNLKNRIDYKVRSKENQ